MFEFERFYKKDVLKSHFLSIRPEFNKVECGIRYSLIIFILFLPLLCMSQNASTPKLLADKQILVDDSPESEPQNYIDTNSQKTGIPNFFDRSYIYNFDKKYPYKENTNLLFETKLAFNYLVYSNERKKKPNKFAITLVPEFRMRLLNELSGPIVNPSYVAHLRYHKSINNNRKFKVQRNYIISLNHHSNGKGGHIINDTLKDCKTEKCINLENGSFSTHYLDFYHFWTFTQFCRERRFTHNFGIGFEEHFPDSIGKSEIPGSMSQFLAENFGKHRIIFDYSMEHTLLSNNIFNGSRLLFHVNYSYSLTKPKGNELHIEFLEPEKLPRDELNIEMIFKPDWVSDIGFFLRFRSGQDHYNLYFFNNLTQLQFGVVLNKAQLKLKERDES